MKPTYGRLREKKTYFRVWLHATLRKLDFHFLSNRLGYDRGDSFLFDFEPNGIPFGSKSIGTLSQRLYIPVDLKEN